MLDNTKAKFLLSTWYKNQYRENIYINSLWKKFNIDTFSHFYFVGGLEHNRNAMQEALICNYNSNDTNIQLNTNTDKQLILF